MTPRPARDLPNLLKVLLLDPIGTMRAPVTLSWPAIVVLVSVSAILSGGLVGLINHNALDLIIGLFVFPLTTLVITFVFSFFIYYKFTLFHATFLDFRRLVSIVTLALAPYFLFHTVSSFIAPIDLLGFALTALLLIVGLVEQFGLERKTCVRLVTGMTFAFFIVWSIGQFRATIRGNDASRMHAPKALDEIR